MEYMITRIPWNLSIFSCNKFSSEFLNGNQFYNFDVGLLKNFENGAM